MLAALRKVLPLKGHKAVGVFTKFEAACQCGWHSCPHNTRAEAWSEWRAHVISCGGEREPYEKSVARRDREVARALKSAAKGEA